MNFFIWALICHAQEGFAFSHGDDEIVAKKRGWYWREYGDDYTRASVGSDVEEFVGWDTLLDLINECENTEYSPSPAWKVDPWDYRGGLIRRDQALIAALFLTGGRVSEVIGLRSHNFRLRAREVRVHGMSVLKRYRKTGSYRDSEGSKRYYTEPVVMTRGIFSINREEPLVPYLLTWLDSVDDYLFPSPSRNPYLSRQRAYQIVTDIGERVGLKIWNHWFRSQRASQLVTEYSFDIHVLADWFKWSKLDTARTYTKLDPTVYENLYAEKRKQKTLQQQLDEQRRTIKKLKSLVPEEKLQEISFYLPPILR
ncbi:MAG: tyrosine-type recombinase/integrase [archaeon]